MAAYGPVAPWILSVGGHDTRLTGGCVAAAKCTAQSPRHLLPIRLPGFCLCPWRFGVSSNTFSRLA